MSVTQYSSAEIARTCAAFEENKHDYRKECEKINALAVECGLPKDKAEDVRISLAYLKGIVAGRRKV